MGYKTKMTRPSFLRPASFFEEPKEKLSPTEYSREYRKTHRRNLAKPWVGIDGEGITTGDPLPMNALYSCVVTGDEHRYISMSYRDRDGKGDELITDKLTTKDCLEFILSIPEEYKIAGYGFTYDLTKILEDVPTESIHLLTHPELRAFSRKGAARIEFRPVEWNGYLLDFLNGQFKVGRVAGEVLSPLGTRRYRGRDWRVIYDLIKFYQCSFVSACENWGVGTEKEREIMLEMKKDRRNLIKYTQAQVLEYSNKECLWLAELAHKLDDACEALDIQLGNTYFGAGSIAKKLLAKWSEDQEEQGLPTIKDQVKKPIPPPIELAAAQAFFGGRFEISRRGLIQQEVHDLDISSAYPYQIYQLPCLACGEWTLTKDIERVRESNAALCHYALDRWKGSVPAWGPFPFRMGRGKGIPIAEKGSVPCPIESGGGWIHKDEFLQGQRMWPNVRFIEAWVYETRCKHRPFEQVPKAYLERLRIGKEGPGIIIKLGVNAVAGNIMQTLGSRPYFNIMWAGMITSGTRFQLLQALERHELWSDVLLMATDGMWSLKRVEMPKPIDTGTDIDVIEEKSGKVKRAPLGGWEHDTFKQGVFLARPGIYFPLDLPNLTGNETADQRGKILKNVKARGIGVKTLYRHRDELIEWYTKWHGAKGYVIADDDIMRTIRDREEPLGAERFIGMKAGITSRTTKAGKRQVARRSLYGRWTVQTRIINFGGMPKREEGNGPLFGDTERLYVRRVSQELTSAPYEKMTEEDAGVEGSDSDQPDGGFE